MSIPRRSYTLAVTRPGNLTSLPAAKIAVFQACELDLTLRLPTGETFDGATQVRLEIHTSQTSDPDDVLTTFVVNSPTGNTLTLGLTGDYLNHTFTGPLGEFWLNIVAHWEDTDRIEPLRCANLFLHRHNASLTTPPPPAGLIPYVRFDIAQTGLTTQQEQQARTNISAASETQVNDLQTEVTNLASSTTNALGSKADLVNGLVPAEQLPASSGGTWGSITGSLSAQTDLQSALDAKASMSHDHSGQAINPGTIGATTATTSMRISGAVDLLAWDGIIRAFYGNGYSASLSYRGLEAGAYAAVYWTGGSAGANANNITLSLWQDSSGILAQRNGSSAQKHRIYGDASKYLQMEHDGADAIISASSGALKLRGSVFEPFTVGTVPSASVYIGGPIYVSNESGGAVLAFSDGTNWRRVTDRAIIS